MEVNGIFLNIDGIQLFRVIITLILGYLAIKIITAALLRGKVFERLDPTIASFLTRFVRFILNIVYIIIVLSMLGVPMTTFIAMLSALGLAIALALQGNLSNFASTLMIFTFKPFKVGDFIESQNNIGTVKEIQMLFTHILTPDNRKLIVPNSDLVNSRIINYTSEETRRIDLVFSASYDDDIHLVKETIIKLVKEHESILNEPEPIVRLAHHNQNSLDYDVKIWVKKSDYWKVRYDLHEQVREAFINENITIPFAQHMVWVNEGIK